jgi:hypothetical protein
MTAVLSWRFRLAAMDHSRGTSNKMIQAAMTAEIKDLRKLLAPEAVEWRKAKLVVLRNTKLETRLRGTIRELRAGMVGHNRVVNNARAARDEWKAAALRYRKQVIEKSLQP